MTSRPKPREIPRRASLPETIAGQLREAIFQGRLQAGDRLDSEATLAERFNTNRTTLREAIRILANEGLVSVGQGRQAQIADFRRTAGLNLLPHYLTALADPLVALEVAGDLLRVRREFIIQVVPESVENATATALRPALEIGERLLTMRQEKSRRISMEDIEFYRAIIQAGGHMLHMLLLNTFLGTFQPLAEMVFPFFAFPESYFERIERMLPLIAGRRIPELQALVREHFESLDAETVEMLLLAGQALLEAGE